MLTIKVMTRIKYFLSLGTGLIVFTIALIYCRLEEIPQWIYGKYYFYDGSTLPKLSTTQIFLFYVACGLAVVFVVLKVLWFMKKMKRDITKGFVRQNIGTIIIGLVCMIVAAAGVIYWMSNPVNLAHLRLHSTNSRTRIEGIKFLSRFKFDKGGPPRYKQAYWHTASPSPEDKRSAKKIRGLLNDADITVRDAAIYGLVSLGDDESIPEIRKMLADVNMRRMAIYALGQFSDRTSVPEIREFLNKGDNWVRINAINFLVQFNDKESIPEIIKRLSDPNEWVRYTALKAMDTLQVKEAIPDIIKLLVDQSNDVRRVAVEVLGKWQVKEATPDIIKLLSDQSNDVRRVAVEILGRWQVKEAIPMLIKLLSDSNPYVCGIVVEVLGTLQVREAIPDIIKLLTNSNGYVRRTAAGALGKLQAIEAIPDIIKLLADQDGDVRYVAKWVLDKFGVSQEDINKATKKK